MSINPLKLYLQFAFFCFVFSATMGWKPEHFVRLALQIAFCCMFISLFVWATSPGGKRK